MKKLLLIWLVVFSGCLPETSDEALKQIDKCVFECKGEDVKCRNWRDIRECSYACMYAHGYVHTEHGTWRR